MEKSDRGRRHREGGVAGWQKHSGGAQSSSTCRSACALAYNALKSSGTSPHFLITLASPKLPVAGSRGPRQRKSPLRSARGSPGTYALKTIHEVRQTADIDVRSPRGYHIRTCNGGRLIFLVAEPLPSVRHTTDHRSHTTDHRGSLRQSESLLPFPGDDDAANGRLTVGKRDAAQQTHPARLPDRQTFRSRQGRARLH
jgi:hypothetical protein